ncbi:hypothetical protein Dsin_012301 [Dipteronia sinensis]|uniref:MYB transcription factor n=1 Tax=Dipteronia sinensis TaxID=43782 RepID=A0AAE0E7W4_9ROSI|nr:hypothetical protein Dsin_012301 [Dipteronia sinensis]
MVKESARKYSQCGHYGHNSRTCNGIAWTEKEHSDFLAGLNMLGKGNWKGISMNFVKTRNPSQVASHAQKYFLRLSSADNKNRRASLFDIHYQQSALPTCQDSLPVENTAANFSSSQTRGFLVTSNMPTLSYVPAMPAYRYMPGNITTWAHPSGIPCPQSVSGGTFQSSHTKSSSQESSLWSS